LAALELGVGVGIALETGVSSLAFELCAGLVDAIADPQTSNPKTKTHNNILNTICKHVTPYTFSLQFYSSKNNPIELIPHHICGLSLQTNWRWDIFLLNRLT
jgi:hypothetical protein